MNEELRNYIENLFADAPKTRAAYELKEELLANSMERYRDLVNDQVPEKEALDIVIHSIGNISQLFTEEEQKNSEVPVIHSDLKKTALYRAVAVSMYILGFCAMIVMEEFTSHGKLGIIALLLFSAVATGILVYVGAAYPSYRKNDDTVVEEFKEWNSGQKKRREIRQSVNTIVQMLILVAYFLTSFITGAWHITWIIFLAGACLQAIVSLIFKLKEC